MPLKNENKDYVRFPPISIIICTEKIKLWTILNYILYINTDGSKVYI